MSSPIILEKNNGFYSIPLFEAYGVRAIFTTRKFNMAFENPARRQAYKKIGLSGSRLIFPSQVHEDRVFLVTKKDRGRGASGRRGAIAKTDALMAHQSHVPIAILTADCLPVFIFDRVKRAVALVHAGWKGINKQIIARTIQKMSESFQSQPSDLMILLGPAIRSCCYEVKDDFLGYFKKGIHRKGSKLYFDIAEAAIDQMTQHHVASDRIYDSYICTSCMNHEFFSYRREGLQAGRSMSVMELL